MIYYQAIKGFAEKENNLSNILFTIPNLFHLKFVDCQTNQIPTIMAEKIKYEIEIPIQSSPSLLYQYISTPSGLSEWYAPNVNFRGEIFTFIWEHSEEQAKLITRKKDERIRFKWIDDGEDPYFFELRIQLDEITKDVSLIITDFAEEDELEESKMLWENMISELKHVLGSG